MRALLIDAPGGPDRLYVAEQPALSPGLGETVIAVKAAGVNFSDTLIIEDKYQVKPQRPFSPGSEAAGIVKAIGAGVMNLAVGDRVVARASYGAMAEEFRVPADACFKLPEGAPFDEAAGLITAYASALHGLKDRGHLKSGETLLVLGASGGVGVAAIELGKAMGARVIGAASSPDKAAFAQAKGADVGICYPAGPALSADQQRAFADLLKSETAGRGADVVFDAIGGDYAEPALRATAWNGRYLIVGFVAGIPRLPLNLAMLKGNALVGVNIGGFADNQPDDARANIRELIDLWSAGKIRPHVEARVPLDKAADAFRLLIDRKVQGKVVITMDGAQ